MPVYSYSKNHLAPSLWIYCGLWVWVMNLGLTLTIIYKCGQATPTHPNIGILFYLLEENTFCLLAWERVKTSRMGIIFEGFEGYM